ncbi:MAG TPA: sigma-70 family RNA polymerase sigma factor [Ktedonobacteraceae bacterium]|nr:sigma-70 family RNA polymerase sigma factor [Ktedonobacteraceae bacterium]
MEHHHLVTTPFISAEERALLVRYCAALSGRPEIAEDLTQETLLEAWRSLQTLRDPSRRPQWLKGIARNVYLRWLRRQGREQAHLYQGNSSQPALDDAETEQLFVDDYTIELDLERKELLELLDRALTLLPEETRTALIQHYIHDSPLAEVAAQLGTNPNALAVRLQRGRLALRRLLTEEMQQEFTAFRQSDEAANWEVTSLWCFRCGKQRLLGKRASNKGRLLLKCPACCPDDRLLSRSELPLLQGLKGYKPMLTRLRGWAHGYYRSALTAYFAGESIRCEACGRAQEIFLTTLEQLPTWMQETLWDMQWFDTARLLSTACIYCQATCNTSLSGLALALPETQAFLRAYTRCRTLPAQSLEAQGRPALLIRFEGIDETVALNIISDAETYRVLRIESEGC